VALFSVAFGLPPIALKAVVSLRGFRFDINCLMTFATIGAIALRDFTEAAAVTFLFALSEWLELRATSRARNALSSIVKLRPERANLIHPKSGEIVVVPVGVVPVGALVSVKAGDKIPCDGVVIEGQSTVDESSLTGESRPVRKGPGDGVSGGTINSGNTQMTVRTTASSEDSAVARLIRLVEEAQANRSDTERLVDDFASIYTPVVILAAICMCTIPWGWGPEVGSKWTELGLVLIVIACPCALIISTPVTYVAGLAATAQRGVLIKGGAHLEALGMVKTVCFDKTGTLTQGKFQLLHLDIFGTKFSRKEVLEYLSLMEDRASHPLARALVEGAEKEGVKVPQGRFVRNHTFLPGEGIVGTIDGVTVHVGNQRLLERLRLYATLSESGRNKVDDWGKIGTVGFMCVGENDIVCAYCVADAIRPEATEIVQHLKVLGIDVMMVTGDKKETALSIGNTIGLALNNIRSELLPEDKLAIVSDLKLGKSGRQSVLTNFCSSGSLVLMCGDGVNDAPALAAADVGVAVAGSTLAMETADVTLLDSKLTKLVYSIEMGRRAIRKIKENVTFSLVVKFLVLGFALAGKAALWAAIASDVGAMLVVTLNSMMLLPAKGTTTAETGDIANISAEPTRKDEKEVQDIEQACTEEEKS
jgi:Cd2+/Zn2+-exporting ATPase